MVMLFPNTITSRNHRNVARSGEQSDTTASVDASSLIGATSTEVKIELVFETNTTTNNNHHPNADAATTTATASQIWEVQLALPTNNTTSSSCCNSNSSPHIRSVYVCVLPPPPPQHPPSSWSLYSRRHRQRWSRYRRQHQQLDQYEQHHHRRPFLSSSSSVRSVLAARQHNAPEQEDIYHLSERMFSVRQQQVHTTTANKSAATVVSLCPWSLSSLSSSITTTTNSIKNTLPRVHTHIVSNKKRVAPLASVSPALSSLPMKKRKV